jgi:hypothetical protein
VIHVDGALGGITPRGFIHVAIFSERPALPQTTEHEVSAEGQVSDPIAEEGKAGIVREMDADLIMTKQAATELRDWLTERIEQLEAIEQERERTGRPVIRTSNRTSKRRNT